METLQMMSSRRNREGDGAITPLGAGSLAGAGGVMVSQVGGADRGKAARDF